MNKDDLMNHKFIVLGISHYNNVGLCKSIREAGYNVIFIEISGRKPSKFMMRHASSCVIVNSIEDGVIYIYQHFIDHEHKAFLLTGQDDVVSMLDKHYDELIKNFYFFNCCGKGNVSWYMSKQNMYQLSDRVRMYNAPAKWELLTRGELPHHLRYPIITKVTNPNSGAWKLDVNICKNDEEMLAAWDKISADEILAQEFVRKINELDVQGFSINDGDKVICTCALEYVRFSDKGYGFYMRTIPIPETVVDDICRIVKGMKYNGIFCIEWVRDENNKLHFCEINLRNDGYGYLSTHCGYNLPIEWAKATLNCKTKLNQSKIQYFSRTAMVANVDMKQIIRYKVNAFTWLWQYLTIDCLLDGDKNCPWYLYALAKALRMGFVKMWFKSTFRLYKEEDYPYAF